MSFKEISTTWLVLILSICFHSDKKKKKKKRKAKDSDNEGEDATEDLADLDGGGQFPQLSPTVQEDCAPTVPVTDNEVLDNCKYVTVCSRPCLKISVYYSIPDCLEYWQYADLFVVFVSCHQISQGEDNDDHDDDGRDAPDAEEDEGDPPSRASSSPGSDADYEIINHGDLTNGDKCSSST